MQSIIQPLQTFIDEENYNSEVRSAKKPEERNAEHYHGGQASGAQFAMNLIPKELFVFSLVKTVTLDEKTVSENDELYFDEAVAQTALNKYVDKKTRRFCVVGINDFPNDVTLYYKKIPTREINVKIVKRKVN